MRLMQQNPAGSTFPVPMIFPGMDPYLNPDQETE
jgi:hypothetical protein